MRLAQSIILCGIAAAPRLSQDLVLKGGNALDFVWLPNRSTVDLDFSIDGDAVQLGIDEQFLRGQLGQAFRVVGARFGAELAVHNVNRQPPGTDKDFVTYRVRVGYALSDDVKLLARMKAKRHSTNVIDIYVSINEPICNSTPVAIAGTGPNIRVCTLEDIVAEKLRALLQQVIRKRDRKQDLLDLAVVISERPGLDRGRVAGFLIVKASARGVKVSKAAFREPEVARRAAVDYETLRNTTRNVFIPFDQALAIVLAFVDQLPIDE